MAPGEGLLARGALPASPDTAPTSQGPAYGSRPQGAEPAPAERRRGGRRRQATGDEEGEVHTLLVEPTSYYTRRIEMQQLTVGRQWWRRVGAVALALTVLVVGHAATQAQEKKPN